MKKAIKIFGVFLLLISSSFILQIGAEEINILGFSPQLMDIEIGSTFTVSIFADIMQESDTVEVSNLSWTAPGIVNYSSCAQGTLFTGTVFYIDPDAPPGKYNNSLGWARPITQSVILSSINNTNGTLGILTMEAVGTGTSSMVIDLGKTIRNGVLLSTDYSHIARIRVHPLPPNNLMATQNDPGIVNLSWDKEFGSTYTRIIGSQNGYPINPSDDILIYNGTENNCVHTIAVNETWYYTAWSYSNGLYSITNTQTSIHPITYSLIIQINGNGTVENNPDLLFYPINSTVQLTANPKIGWKFSYWQHYTQINENPYNLTITANTTITTTFIQQYYIINTITNGSGSITLNPNTSHYAWNSTVSLNATPSDGWLFNHWSGDITGIINPATILINENKTVIAHFQKEYVLNTTTIGNGILIMNPSGGKYVEGSVVTINATPAQFYEFSHWSGDLAGNQNPATITMDMNKTVIGHFVQPEYYLNFSTEGNGTISLIPNGTKFVAGTNIQVTARPEIGWRFSNWTGYIDHLFPTFNLTMNQSMNITAWFKIQNFSISLKITGNGNVTRLPNYPTYEYNISVDLSATPDNGWEFDKWNKDVSSKNPQITLLMTNNKTLEALFKKKKSNPPGGGGGSPGSGSIPLNNPPLAIINVNPSTRIFINENILFDGSSSWDPDNDQITFLWELPENISKTNPFFYHKFNEVGQYIIKLTVEDPFGDKSTATVTIDVVKGNHPPEILTITGPSIGKSNTSIEFTITSIDKDNDNLQYKINWGDNTKITRDYLINDTSFSTTHQWPYAGLYKLAVEVNDEYAIASGFKYILIDGEYVYNIGYLLDKPQDAIYDSFISNNTGKTTEVGIENPWYLLDEDDDETWDWQYNPQTKELKEYIDHKSSENYSQWIIIIMISSIILIISFVLFRKNRI